MYVCMYGCKYWALGLCCMLRYGIFQDVRRSVLPAGVHITHLYTCGYRCTVTFLSCKYSVLQYTGTLLMYVYVLYSVYMSVWLADGWLPGCLAT